MTRHLITTALEETWPSEDTPVLFLGEWCKIYNRKEKWSRYNSEVVPYHWDDRKKLYKDYLYLRGLYEEILKELADKLNEIHGVNKSLRYWRILIGPWLGYFIQILFDRYEMIQRVVDNYELGGTNTLYKDFAQFVANDMSTFDFMYMNDAWNQFIYEYIICNYTKIKISKVESLHPFVESKDIQSFSIKRKIRRTIASLLSYLSKLFVKDSEAFLIADYLPLKESFRFQLSLKQIPRLWRLVPTAKINSELQKRNWSLLSSNKNQFEEFLRKFIPFQIPTSYLEGFSNLQQQVAKLPWPKSPKFIFTSNSYCNDEVFKTWTGNKVESGTPLVIGQHGGHYGVGLWSFMEEHEIAISDRYLTWGWSEKENRKVFPNYAIKLSGKGMIHWNPKGKMLLVTMVLPRYSYWMYSAPIASQINSYLEDQFCFVRNLNKTIQKEIIIRLFPIDNGWNQKERWKDNLPHIQLDLGTRKMDELMSESRLYISTYNATTFLESMGRNMPTIMFWNPNHWEFRESAKPYFEKLKSVGIFHETPESAAKKVSEIWEDVSSWWNSKEVQKIKNEFCYQYARRVKNELEVLSNSLNIEKERRMQNAKKEET